MLNTVIGWAHHTLNFWMGCNPITPECDNCYAEDWAFMTQSPKTKFTIQWGAEAERKRTSDKIWKLVGKMDRDAASRGQRERVFVNSLSDFFEFHKLPEENQKLEEWRVEAGNIMKSATSLDFLLLTKRPENVRQSLMNMFGESEELPQNLWLGFTAGMKETLRKNLVEFKHLIEWQRPFVTFISAEPVLEDVLLYKHLHQIPSIHYPDWIIVGGESNNRRLQRSARETKLEWILNLITDAEVIKIPCFTKQLGSNVTYLGNKVNLKESHGVDLSEWPEVKNNYGEVIKYPRQYPVRSSYHDENLSDKRSVIQNAGENPSIITTTSEEKAAPYSVFTSKEF